MKNIFFFFYKFLKISSFILNFLLDFSKTIMYNSRAFNMKNEYI